MSDSLLDDQQEQIEDAAGSVHYWREKRLYPFSFERNCAYERLGLDVESNLECCTAVVFLCTLGEELVEGSTTGIDIIESARGEQGIKAFRTRMGKWANEQGLTSNNEDGLEVCRVGVAIFKEIGVSRFKPEGTASPNG